MFKRLTKTGLFTPACAMVLAMAMIPAMAADRVTGKSFATRSEVIAPASAVLHPHLIMNPCVAVLPLEIRHLLDVEVVGRVHVHLFDDLLEHSAPGQLNAYPVVAALRTHAGGDQVADSGQSGKGGRHRGTRWQPICRRVRAKPG